MVFLGCIVTMLTKQQAGCLHSCPSKSRFRPIHSKTSPWHFRNCRFWLNRSLHKAHQRRTSQFYFTIFYISQGSFVQRNQKFRKGVGGQRGLAQGNPSHTINQATFLLPMAPYEVGERNSGGIFCWILGTVGCQPLKKHMLTFVAGWSHARCCYRGIAQMCLCELSAKGANRTILRES